MYSEKILDNLAAAGETSYIKENAIIMQTLSKPARKLICLAKDFNGGGAAVWVYAGVVALVDDTRHFWASEQGHVVASKAWVKRYGTNGDWLRTWRLKKIK